MYQEFPINPRQEKRSPTDQINICHAEGWTIGIDAGAFDVPLYESITREAAEIYYSKAIPLSSVPLVIKPSSEIRKLNEVFVDEEILISLSV